MDELSKEAVLSVPDSDDEQEDLASEEVALLPDFEDEQEDLTLADVALLPACGCCDGVHDVKNLETSRLTRTKHVMAVDSCTEVLKKLDNIRKKKESDNGAEID
ncbi:hypothetical protein ABZP36_021358 [Zizania latifolia]